MPLACELQVMKQPLVYNVYNDPFIAKQMFVCATPSRKEL